MTSRIYCIAEFEPKLGHEQELFEKLTSLEPLALREDGCVRYRVTRQIKHPQAMQESKFSIMFNEEWASIEAFEEHCAQPYLVDFLSVMSEIQRLQLPQIVACAYLVMKYSSLRG